MKHPVVSIHSLNGRVRLRCDTLYRATRLAPWIQDRLHEHRWIREAKVNPLTATVLLRYEPDQITITDLAQLLEGLLKEASRPETQKRIRSHYHARTGHKTSRAHAQPWHAFKRQKVMKLLQSRSNGLSEQVARARLSRIGPNSLPGLYRRSDWDILSGQFKNLPSALLAGSAVLSILTGGLGDAVVIIVVIGVNAYVGYRNESAAEETIHGLTRSAFPRCKVVRSDKLRDVPVEEIVPGDVLLLSPGTPLPADIRLLEVDHFTVDESALTGESLPVAKNIQALTKPNIPLADRNCLAFRGTTVTGGSAKGVVVATGQDTEIGKIEALMGASRSPETPLQKQLGELTERMITLCLIASGGVVALGALRGRRWVDTLRSAVSLAVAAIPEGLPTVATMTLAGGVESLKKHDLIVRRLEAIETLGNIDVLCLDKTGTLTLNQMAVTSMATLGKGPGEPNTRWFRTPEGTMLARIVALCNEAQSGQGSSTENALLRFAETAGFDIRRLRQQFPIASIQHRGERRSYMITTHRLKNGNTLVAAKGNPTDLLALCGYRYREGRVEALTDQDRAEIHLQNETMAGQALRILGAAFRENGRTLSSVKGKLVWVGMVGMSDPLRPGIKPLIEKIQAAGIRTVMLTGDQSATAYAIGKQLGLSRGQELNLVDSTRLEEIPSEVLSTLAHEVHVFSRVSPSHKLQIVQALQKAGHVVAMTGDGINDGPALKVADVGLAVDGKGTEVARKVADMVLLRADLDSILLAIEEGRTIRENIRKAVEYIASQNLSEILFTFVSNAIGLGEPLSAAQLLWVNLVTDVFPELALVRESPESDILKRQPREMRRGIVAPGDYGRVSFEAASITAASLASYFYGVRKYGMENPKARTMAFLTLNTASLLHAQTARSESLSVFDLKRPLPNRSMAPAIGAGFAAELLAVVVPGIRAFLASARITPKDFLLSGALSAAPFLVNEGAKFARHRRRKHTHAL